MSQSTVPQSLPQRAVPESANVLIVSGAVDLTQTTTTLLMADGQLVRLPTALLQQHAVQDAGTFEAERGAPLADSEPRTAATIPLIEESMSVSKRTVATGKVRLQKTVHEYQETLDEPLAVRSFDIERVVLNRPVETAPGVRYEGETTIFPLIEEQLILTKQLILKEELRVTKRDTERRDTQVVTLRREHVTVERLPPE